MPSQNNDSGKRIKWWINHFWPLPLPHKSQQLESLGRIIVIPNALGFRENVPVSLKNSLLVVDTGGYLPEFAGSFGNLNPDVLWQALNRIRNGRDLPDNPTLLVPQGMARLLGLENFQRVNGYLVSLIADLPWKTASPNVNERRRLLPGWAARMTLAMPPTFGQMTVFALALIVFGPLALLWGEITLLLAGLSVAVCWRLVNAYGVIRGFLTGVGLGIIVGVIALTLVNQVDIAWKLAAGLILCCTWMGLVFEGLKP